jgi:hypothetical protein
MKKFIIKRAMTGVSGAPKHELDKAGKAFEAVLIKSEQRVRRSNKGKVT